jgi:hypothetical protein
MNLERAGRSCQQGAADVSSAELFTDASAGKMPAAPCGSWKTIVIFGCLAIKRGMGFARRAMRDSCFVILSIFDLRHSLFCST